MDGGFEPALQTRTQGVLDNCTACGRCVEVCPMPGPAGLDAADAPGIAAGVLAILRGESRRRRLRAGRRYAPAAATASGLPARGEPALHADDGAAGHAAPQRRRHPAEGWFCPVHRHDHRCARAVAPAASAELLARFRAEDDTADDAPPDVVFYTGCNLLKTPHIALLCFDIMDAMGLRYRVMGGPSHCCGVLQFRAGDLATPAALPTARWSAWAAPADAC